ncbi:MAG: glycine cleavage system protein GcvH [bacterium]
MINAIDVLCAKSHEYAVKEGSSLTIGITDYAVEQLGDIVFVELPEVGSSFEKGDVFGTIESVKAASELYMPVGGKVVEINEKLTTEPELMNVDSYNDGWLIKIEGYSEDELSELMAYDEYKESLD